MCTTKREVFLVHVYIFLRKKCFLFRFEILNFVTNRWNAKQKINATDHKRPMERRNVSWTDCQHVWRRYALLAWPGDVFLIKNAVFCSKFQVQISTDEFLKSTDRECQIKLFPLFLYIISKVWKIVTLLLSRMDFWFLPPVITGLFSRPSYNNTINIK